MGVEQRVISDWEKSQPTNPIDIEIAKAASGGEIVKPDEVIEAEETLKFYKSIGREIVGKKFKEEIEAVKGKQEKKIITKLQTQFRQNLIDQQTFQEGIGKVIDSLKESGMGEKEITDFLAKNIKLK